MSQDASMRLIALQMHHVRMPLRVPFKHATATHRYAESIIVSITAEHSISRERQTGFGEIIPRAYLSGETLIQCRQTVTEKLWPALQALVIPLKSEPFACLQPVYESADRYNWLAAYSGLDIAIFDAWARLAKISLSTHWSNARPAVPAVAPIPLNGSVRCWGLLFRLLGFRHFKLKIAKAADWQRLQKLRHIIGNNAELNLDANNSLSLQEALTLLEILQENALPVELLEEPVAARAFAAMQALCQQTGISIVADESLCNQNDARTLIRSGAAQVFNLRLAKIGGFSGFKALSELATAHQIRIRLGVLVGETTAMAAAAAAASFLAPVETYEYGFARYFVVDDPFRGGPCLRRGYLQPATTGMGLGVDLIGKRLAKIIVREP